MLREHIPPSSAEKLAFLCLVMLAIGSIGVEGGPQPGSCAHANNCGFAGTCIDIPGPPAQHTCSCKQPFGGEDCSLFAVGEPVIIGTSVTRSVEKGAWDYFELTLPLNSPTYKAALKSSMEAQEGECGFVMSDAKVQFFTAWKSRNYALPNVYSNTSHFYHSTPLDLLMKNAIAVSVYGIDNCRYSGSFFIQDRTFAFCEHGNFKSGICQCSNRWAGPNCDKFTFPIVFSMAIAAGTFIFGALASGVLAGCIFHKRAEASVNGPVSQGYEQYR